MYAGRHTFRAKSLPFALEARKDLGRRNSSVSQPQVHFQAAVSEGSPNQRKFLISVGKAKEGLKRHVYIFFKCSTEHTKELNSYIQGYCKFIPVMNNSKDSPIFLLLF